MLDLLLGFRFRGWTVLRRGRRRGGSAEEVCLPPIRVRPTRHHLAFPV